MHVYIASYHCDPNAASCLPFSIGSPEIWDTTCQHQDTMTVMHKLSTRACHSTMTALSQTSYTPLHLSTGGLTGEDLVSNCKQVSNLTYLQGQPGTSRHVVSPPHLLLHQINTSTTSTHPFTECTTQYFSMSTIISTILISTIVPCCHWIIHPTQQTRQSKQQQHTNIPAADIQAASLTSPLTNL